MRFPARSRPVRSRPARRGARPVGAVRRAIVAATLAACGMVAAASTPQAASAAGAASAADASAALVEVVPAVDVEDVAESVRADAVARVAQMDVATKAASVVMGHIATTDPAQASAYVAESGVGGFILMGANIPGSAGELRELTDALRGDPAFPVLLAVDQEGGDVARLPDDGFASARTLKDAPPDDARGAFAARAGLVRQAGIDVNFGVVADVTGDASMFIYRRALGATPEGAAERVAAAVTGESPLVASTLKHFPGHGAAPGDSHRAIPDTDESLDRWRATDAVPFAAGIEAGAPLLMFGHLRFTAVDGAPASLSAEWHRIARDELGFDGVAVTDDLGMLESSGDPAYADPVANAVAALAAGNDLVLTVLNTGPGSASAIVEGIVAAVQTGSLPAERLDEAATRVAALRLEHAAAGGGFAPCADCAPAS